jgi:hypothetical protein
MKDDQESKGKKARRHKEFRIGENWTVLAETHGDGIGLPRGTKILVREAGSLESGNGFNLCVLFQAPRLCHVFRTEDVIQLQLG